MARPEKVQAVADIKERMEGARAVFLAEYAGLSVKEQQELRRSLRAGGAEFKIVKMTLARRAAAELDIDTLDDLLLGPTGLTFADRDAVEAAKALKDFAASHEALKVKGGLLGTDFLTPERVSQLADIEPRDVLLAKLAGGFQAPMARLAGLVAALPRNMANAMLQLLDKKEEAAPAAAQEEPSSESPDAEAPQEQADEPAAVEAEVTDAPEPDDAATEAPGDEASDLVEAAEATSEDTTPAPEDAAAEAPAEDTAPEATPDDTESTPEVEADASAEPDAEATADEAAEDQADDSAEEED